MGMRRKNLVVTLAAVGIIAISAAGALYWIAGGRTDEVSDDAAQMAATASKKLAPVISWKVRMLRYIGF